VTASLGAARQAALSAELLSAVRNLANICERVLQPSRLLRLPPEMLLRVMRVVSGKCGARGVINGQTPSDKKRARTVCRERARTVVPRYYTAGHNPGREPHADLTRHGHASSGAKQLTVTPYPDWKGVGMHRRNARFRVGFLYQVPRALKLQIQHRSRPWRVLPASFSPT
jgi:hypothetical protein